MISKILLVSLATLLASVHCENILVFFAGGSYSHKLSMWPLVTALAERGHNVTVLSGFKHQPSRSTKVHELFSHTIFNMTHGFYAPDRVRDRLEGKHSQVFQNFISMSVKTCETIMEAEDDLSLEYVINEGKFDLVIDNGFLGECGMIIAHQKRAKLIYYFAGSFIPWFHDEFGFPSEHATIPDNSFDYRFPMTAWQRFQNYLAPLYWFLTRRVHLYPKLESMMQRKYNMRKEDVPPFENIVQETKLVLLGSHYSADFARTLPPFVVNVGGMHCFVPAEPLTGELKTMLDEARNGAVLVSFGSTVNLATLPLDIKTSLFSMMKRFPKILFIWRWDGLDPKDKPENMVTSKWLPQFQILGKSSGVSLLGCHPNLKAFISHGGLNSMFEGTFHGIPVILTPLFGDQDFNGYRVEAKEIGIRLEMREINTELLVKSLDQILNNPKYSKNMKDMSSLFRDRPMNPIDTAVFWTEFVIRHNDTKSMKPFHHLTFFQRRLFDVALLAFVIISFGVVVLISFLGGLSRRWLDFILPNTCGEISTGTSVEKKRGNEKQKTK